jgi:hypothetical protein
VKRDGSHLAEVRRSGQVRQSTGGDVGAVAWGALGSAVLLTALAVRLARWRRSLAQAGSGLSLDLTAAEAEERADSLAFDAIVGNLLLTDPAFADTADRMARRDDTGPPA